MAVHKPPQVEFELDTFELLILRTPDRPPSLDEATVKTVQAKHVKYLLDQQSAGTLLAAGAVVKHERLTGLALYRTGSIEKVRQLAEGDPAIQAGVDGYEVVNFVCPKGSLSFPLSGKKPG